MSSRYRSRSRTPTRDKRSLSPDGDKERRRQRIKDDKNGDSRALPLGAQTLSDEDYFLKNAEFRSWLKEEKDRVSFCPTT